MHPYNTLTIDLAALHHNVQAIKAKLKKQDRIMPMLKASGYGTDLETLASFMNFLEIDIIGVSNVLEGISLRKLGWNKAIFSIHAARFEIDAVIEHDLEIALSDLVLAKELNRKAALAQKKINVHLDINTGMHRFGIRPNDAILLAGELSKLPYLTLSGVMTHFVGAESSKLDDFSNSQILAFNTVIEGLKHAGIQPEWIHIANSSGVIRFPLPYCNMVRIGLGLFGITSSEDEKNEISFKPALSLETCIVGINDCLQHETIGYGRTYTVTKETQRIAILPIGYHDGIHLHYSETGYVLIHGKKAPFVGKICMDFMMVDISEIPEAQIGDKVLLFGKEHLPIELFAKWGKTNVRELLVCLGPRVARVFVNGPIKFSHSIFQNRILPLMPAYSSLSQG